MPSFSPLFFGSAAHRRYGCYHPGTSHRAVLICPPLWQEYMRAHWACRQLATLLAERGFHVLRFDYRGTGDSAGESSEITLRTLSEDVTLAAQELRDMSGASLLSLVAIRGGLIAAESAGLPFSILALDGVVSGATYIETLQRIHDARAIGNSKSVEDELVGTVVPHPLRSEISKFVWRRESSKTKLFILTPHHEQGAIVRADKEKYHPIFETSDSTDWDSPLHIEQALIIPETLRVLCERASQL